jgi:hypothetical protein
MSSGAKYLAYAIRATLRPREVPNAAGPSSWAPQDTLPSGAPPVVEDPRLVKEREPARTLHDLLEDLTEAMRVVGRDVLKALEPRPAGYPSSHRPVEELSAPPAGLSVPRATEQPLTVLGEVAEEMRAQVREFGQQNLPNGTGDWKYRNLADAYRDDCDMATAIGTLTWRHVLTEEVYEALSESAPDKLRAELVQVSATAATWIAAIDRVQDTS